MASSLTDQMVPNNYWETNHLAYLNPPRGNYTLVAVQFNTTGTRIVDNVIQIGASSVNWVFDQFVLPEKRIPTRIKFFLNVKLNQYECGFKELVKNDTNVTIPTQTETDSIVGFLEWLENHVLRKDGIILLHHDRTNTMPLLLIDRLTRFNLLDRFHATVKGFLNIGYIRDTETGVSFRDCKLSQLVKLLRFNHAVPLRDASDRSEAIFDVIDELLYGNHGQVVREIENGVEYPEGTKQLREMCSRIQSFLSEDKVMNLVLSYARTTKSIELNLEHLTMVLKRQHEYRVVFKGLFDFSAAVRKRTVRLRNKLVAFNIGFHQVYGCWQNFGRFGLERLFSQIYGLRSYDMSFLIEVFDCFFDDRKLPVEEKMKRERHSRWLKMQLEAARQREREEDDEDDANADADAEAESVL